MKRPLIVLTLCLIGLAGCNNTETSGPEKGQPSPEVSKPDASKPTTSEATVPSDDSQATSQDDSNQGATGDNTPNPSAEASSSKVEKPADAIKTPEEMAAAAAEALKARKNSTPAVIYTPRHGDPGWQTSNLSLDEFADRMSASLSGLRNTVAEAQSIITAPDGGEGHYKSEILIKDPKAYRIDYVVLKNVPYSCSMIANGDQRMVRVRDAWTKALPADTPLPTDREQASRMLAKPRPDLIVPAVATPGTAPDLWRTEFTRLLFQGLTDGSDAVAPYLRSLSKNGKVFVQERMTPYLGKSYRNYRVLVENPKDATVSQEIVVDEKRFLPITIRSVWRDQKDAKYAALWICSWKDGNPQPGDFAGPYPTSPKP